jgi:hypothetical protein
MIILQKLYYCIGLLSIIIIVFIILNDYCSSVFKCCVVRYPFIGRKDDGDDDDDRTNNQIKMIIVIQGTCAEWTVYRLLEPNGTRHEENA